MELITAFLLGLAGSLHCAGMCGPLALALPGSGNSASSFVFGRVAYNLGRIVTYSLLGAVFGLIGRTFLLAGFQRWLSIGLGLALLLGLFGSRKLGLWAPVTFLVERLKRRMSFWLRRRSLVSLGVLGLFNGLLPCGLVYVAGAGAAATGGVFAGIKYMAVFGAGTVPMLLAISLFGKLIPVAIRLQWRKAIPLSVFLLALLLIMRGMSLGIPYLSPDLAGGAPACCR